MFIFVLEPLILNVEKNDANKMTAALASALRSGSIRGKQTLWLFDHDVPHARSELHVVIGIKEFNERHDIQYGCSK